MSRIRQCQCPYFKCFNVFCLQSELIIRIKLILKLCIINLRTSILANTPDQAKPSIN